MRPRSLWRRSELGRATMEVVRRNGLEVRNGPFAGLRYPPQALGRTGHIGAKLVGSYEQELTAAIAAMIEQGLDTVVDVGAAEGYYAVGFAMRSPATTVRAYEIDRWQRRLCQRVASVNGVGNRVLVDGRCDLSRLEPERLGRLLVLCDCEGCELELLRPDRHSLLRTANLLVELHDAVDATITPTILGRFAETHEAEVIHAEGRDPSNYGRLAGMAERDARLAILERLGPASWAVLRPRG